MTATTTMMDTRTGQEDKITRKIEDKTKRVPSMTFLGLAVGSMVASFGLMVAERKQLANFVGQWAPTILIMGLYNKLVKIEEELAGRRGAQGH